MPSFFSPLLTGAKGRSGLLTKPFDPRLLGSESHTRQVINNGNYQRTILPLDPVSHQEKALLKTPLIYPQGPIPYQAVIVDLVLDTGVKDRRLNLIYEGQRPQGDDPITALNRAKNLWLQGLPDLLTQVAQSLWEHPPTKKDLEPLWEDMAPQSLPPDLLGIYPLGLTLQRLETYPLPLKVLEDVYEALLNVLPKDALSYVSSFHMRLLLLDHLQNLKSLTFPLDLTEPVKDPHYSPQQKEAMESDAALTLVNSGAGTGKSTVILGRIEYLLDHDLDPERLLVLSFTNAAAKNILQKNPSVTSLTLASFIHQIYTHHYPNHRLSEAITLKNTLEILYPDPFTRPPDLPPILDALYWLGIGGAKAYSRVYPILRTHDIIPYLDQADQTTLDLEAILTYQQGLTLPEHLDPEVIIVDEVQDNSIFEFIFLLSLNKPLFMVGDPSQTLYEFRSSDPKALSLLERSGVFELYKLETNYRSTKAILDFANLGLKDIEANQTAQIQLKPYDSTPIDKTQVELSYTRLSYLRDLDNGFETLLDQVAKPYLEKTLGQGQEVCFLSYTRNHAQRFGDWAALQDLNPQSLIPDRAVTSSLFSHYIKYHRGYFDFIQDPSQVPALMLGQDDLRDLDRLILEEWLSKWLETYLPGTPLIPSLLEFERTMNSPETSLDQEKAILRTSKLLYSTIHSAKGLEFQNTIVLLQGKNNLSEEDKRMYYVAETRAMTSELLLAYGTLKTPQIVRDYEAFLES